MTKQVIQAWIKASRVKFFIATIIPLALGGQIAAMQGQFDWGLWWVIFTASFLVHLNTNLANDYFEYFTGADEGKSIGGSRVLQEGLITLKQIKWALIVNYALALICGLYILWETRLWWLIGVMLFSFFSSLFYTAPPVRYGYHGWGELLVGINMGPVMVAGTSSALLGTFHPQSVLISLPIALMVAFILHYQSFSDIEEDRAVGKYTIAVRLGRNHLVWGYRAFMFTTLASIALLMLLGYVNLLMWLSVLTIPMMGKLDLRIRKIEDIHDLHDMGKPVRLFYLVNGVLLIFGVNNI